MKNFSLGLFGLLLVLSNSVFAADRLLTCAVNNIPQGYEGIRVNIIESQNKLKATVFEGTTVSSSGTFWVQRTERGFEGTDRTGQRSFLLLITDKPAENSYIRGYRANLHHAVIETSHGNKVLSTKASDGLVCGKQVRPYGE